MAKPVSTLESHPDKRAIIDSILQGQSLKSIASRFGVSEQALSRFRNGPMRKALKGRDHAKIQELEHNTVDMIRDSRADAIAVVMGASTASMVESRFSAYDRMLAKAEARDDIAGWGGLARVQLQAYRLRAELSGELVQQAAATTQIMVLMPPHPNAPQPAGEVIDAEIVPE